jgi:class 3 adenylate cyclase
VSVVSPPPTRYAKSGAVHIAYQVNGDGPIDLVFVPPAVSHLDYRWEEPSYERLLNRLGSFARVISLDKRGSGLSDRTAALPTPKEQVHDIEAVMDAAGCRQVSLLGGLDGGAACILFAAAMPERTQRLVTYATAARTLASADYPWGVERAELEALVEMVEQDWGGQAFLRLAAPSVADDARFVQWFGRFQRSAVSPAAAAAWMRGLADIDIRDVLSDVAAPTLVLQRADDLIVNAGNGRYLAAHIRNARYVELPGADYLLWVRDTDLLIDEVQEFLTGVRAELEPDRAVVTVLFTDIVGSTELAARLGDRRWRDLLEAHHAVVRRVLERFRGQEVDTAGDGFFAMFDSPARAIRSAMAIRDELRNLDIDIRAGLHSGEVEMRASRASGLAVHIGARVAALARAGEVLVSGTVRDLVAGSEFTFVDRGTHVLKGVPDEWRLFLVTA